MSQLLKLFDEIFSPRQFFTNGEQGIWLDPSDFSTLFQDAAGTTPVTAVGQPVGLALDKRLGLALGPELVGTYDFTTWATVNAPSPVTENSFTTASTGGVALSPLLTPNRWYAFEIDIENTSAVGIYHGSNNNYGVVAGGRRVIRFKGWCDLTTGIYFRNAAAGTTTIRSISVRELPGNHAYQTTAASRPTVEARVNLATNSEGATATWSVSGVVDATTPIDGFSESLQFGGNSISRSAFKTPSVTNGVTYAVSFFVQMDDGLAPVVGVNGSSGDFCVVAQGNVVTTSATVALVAGSIYRVSAKRTSGATAASNHGVIKYSTQSARTFRVIGIQVEEGTTATTYQRVNTATDYVDVGAPRYNALDKTDDHLLVAAGGAGTTGFLLVAGIMVPAAGTARTLWSDRGTNAGYKVGIDASNQIVFSAGNGAAFTTVTGPALVAGTKYVISAWHDGANLNVSVNNGAPTQAAFVTATAGTATFTVGKSNGAATEYWGDRIYGMIYRKNDASNTSQRNQAYSYMVGKMGGL